MKKIIVTGGSGFVGRNLTCELLRRYPDAEVTSVSRSEGAIGQLLLDCPSERLKIVMADVRDTHAMRAIMKGADTVVHLAAMKRVDLSEDQSHEAAAINVFGTMNALDAFEGDSFVLMSTDKAVEPVNCYGATKLVAEKMVQEYARKRAKQARYMIVRSGNIMGSTGSVMDIWRRQISKTNEITVTHPDMLRYYCSIDGVVRLFVAVLEQGENGKIYFAPHGNAVVLKELVEETLRLYGNPKTTVRYIGLRPGERMAEKMRTTDEPNCISGFEECVKTVQKAEFGAESYITNPGIMVKVAAEIKNELREPK